MSCVLRVHGDFDPAAVLAGTPWVADSLWRRGESGVGGRIIPDSGFTLLVSEAEPEAFGEQIQDAIRFLSRHRPELARLRAIPGVATMSLDFGVAQRDNPAWSLSLPVELVELAGRCGVGIDLSLYAVSGAGGIAP